MLSREVGEARPRSRHLGYREQRALTLRAARRPPPRHAGMPEPARRSHLPPRQPFRRVAPAGAPSPHLPNDREPVAPGRPAAPAPRAADRARPLDPVVIRPAPPEAR